METDKEHMHRIEETLLSHHEEEEAIDHDTQGEEQPAEGAHFDQPIEGAHFDQEFQDEAEHYADQFLQEMEIDKEHMHRTKETSLSHHEEEEVVDHDAQGEVSPYTDTQDDSGSEQPEELENAKE